MNCISMKLLVIVSIFVSLFGIQKNIHLSYPYIWMSINITVRIQFVYIAKTKFEETNFDACL